MSTAGTPRDSAKQYETWDVAGGTITKVTLGYRHLRAAVTTEQERGLDFITTARYSGELSHVRSRTVDQISDVNLPTVSGYSFQWQNTGATKGHTYELTAQAQWVNRDQFSWSSTFIADRTRMKITEWNTSCVAATLTYRCPGFSLGDMYGQRFVRSFDKLPARFRGQESQFQINDDGFLVPVGDADWTDVHIFGENRLVSVNGASLQWGLPIVEENDNATRRFSIIGNGYPDAQVGW